MSPATTRAAETRKTATPAKGAATGAGLRRLLQRLQAPLQSFRMQTALVFGGMTVVLCSVAALALGALMTNEIRRDSARSLEGIAQTAAKTLASGLTQRLLETQVLADSPALWKHGLDTPAVRQAIARAQAAQRHNAWIGVADASGRVMAATSDNLLGQSVAQRPWFGEGLRGAHVGDVHRALLLEKLLPRERDGEPLRFVDFAAPIKVDGKVAGVLGMHGTWTWAREVVTSLMPADALERGLEVYIFDRAGKLLYTPRDAGEGARPITLDDLRTAGAVAPDTARLSTDVLMWPDGQESLTARFVLPAPREVTDLGWQVVAREPTAKAYARAQAARELTFGIGVLLALVAGWLAWLASGVLGRPLERLARSALDVQRLVPGARVPVLDGSREVLALSRAFAGMSQRLTATYQAAPVGMCQLGMDGVMLDANERLGELLDRPRDALLGQRLTDLVAATDQARLEADLFRLSRGKIEKAAIETSIARPPGDALRVVLSASMVAAAEGAPAYYVVVVEDLTERMAAAAAHRASAAKSAFLSQVSHELRTPLNAVLGFSQLMRVDTQDRLSAQQAVRVDAITDAGQHLLTMIDDLLDMTQAESNRLTIPLEPVLVADAVDRSVALVAETARRAGITLEVSPPERAAENCVLANRVRLRQVLVNLLSNAIKYNREGGSVTVQWHAAAGGIELTVQDTGRGIEAAKLEQLFQPFNRLGAEGSGIQGTGIGLVITRKLVELMGGTISVSSRLGRGTTFSVVLPVAEWTAAVIGGEPDEIVSLPAPTGPVARKTVMYVEDNAVNVELLVGVISMRPDIHLVVARNGAEALAMASKSPPDLFLVDMHLGDMTGIELAARLRTRAACAGIPMIGVSADAMPGGIDKAGAAGFAAYLTKPFDIGELFLSLDAVLAASGRTSMQRP